MAAVVVAASLLACSPADEASTSLTSLRPPSTGQARTDAAIPGDAWTAATPADAGLDSEALDALVAEAGAARSSCIAVSVDGRLVASERWGEVSGPREAFSVMKSVTALLVGIAEADGSLSLDDEVATHVPEWRGTPSEEVTIADVLANTSGRELTLAAEAEMALRASDKSAFAIALGQDAEPGTTWEYNNAAIQVLSTVLAVATGEDVAAFAQRAIFDPLDMDETSLTTDEAGNVLTFMGLQTTCEDLARLGLLMAREGAWGDERVVPASFVREATSPSSDLNDAYGLLWWLNRPGTLRSPGVATNDDGAPEAAGDQLVPVAPDDAFWALGFHDQLLYVDPDRQLVAVRLGAKPPPESRFGVVEFTEGVVETIAG